MLESDDGPKPLLIAGGAVRAKEDDEEFGRGNIKQTAIGNENVGTSGNQEFFKGPWGDIYCAGAGYYEAPRVSKLKKKSVTPKSYTEGLIGGKGVYRGHVIEAGFGGGGGYYLRVVNGESKGYYGAGGGFTGGSTKVGKSSFGDDISYGGGGGSFSADPNAKFDNLYVRYGKCKIKKA